MNGDAMSVTLTILHILLILIASYLIGKSVVRINEGQSQIFSLSRSLQFRGVSNALAIAAAIIWIDAIGVLVAHAITGNQLQVSTLRGDSLSSQLVAGHRQQILAEESVPVKEAAVEVKAHPAPLVKTVPAESPAAASLVVNTGASGRALLVRIEPDGDVMGHVPNGDTVNRVTDEIKELNGRRWILVETATGMRGWVVYVNLKPAVARDGA